MIDHSPLAPVGFWKYVKQGIIFQIGSLPTRSPANGDSEREREMKSESECHKLVLAKSWIVCVRQTSLKTESYCKLSLLIQADIALTV